MFKIKAWVFTPQIIICYIFMAAILIAVLSGYTEVPSVHYDRDTDGVIRKYTPPIEDTVIYDAYGTHTLTWRDMKSYQVEITNDGKYAVFHDYDRIAFVVPLHPKCSLNLAIEADND